MEPERAPPRVEGERTFRLDSDRGAQVAKILDGAEVDVGGVVPGVRQIVGLRHASAEHEQETDAPMAEIGERYHRMAADPQHVFEHGAGMAGGLQGLRQYYVIEGVVGVVHKVGVGVALDYGEALGYALVDAFARQLDAA